MGGSKRKRRRADAGRAVPPPPPWEELLRHFIRFAGPIAILVTGVAYDPLCMLLWGEQEIERDIEAKPPDFLALIHRDYAGLGARFFGRDYGQTLMSWIQANYRPVWQRGLRRCAISGSASFSSSGTGSSNRANKLDQSTR
jgi:hypothetical protein